jgi:hypothetical protein
MRRSSASVPDQLCASVIFSPSLSAFLASFAPQPARWRLNRLMTSLDQPR